MIFSGRKRLEYALNFKQADRVPIELYLPENLKDYPNAKKLIKLIDDNCDTFKGIDILNRGFFGVEASYESKLIGEDETYTYTENKYYTKNTEFTQIVQRDKLNVQYCHFKKQFFSNVSDLKKFSQCDFPNLVFLIFLFLILKPGLAKVMETCKPIIPNSVSYFTSGISTYS